MVDKLVPGVTTLTQFGRYYSLYWALADFSAERDLDAETCRTVLRRSEAALAWASLENRDQDPLAPLLHGADRVRSRVDKGAASRMSDSGGDSYSPREWGFWSQYGGPSATLGTVTVEERALRAGPRRCPPSVRGMFTPLFDLVLARPVTEGDITELTALADISIDSDDVAPLRDILLATSSGAGEQSGNDRTRRSVFRMLARAVQLQQSSEPSWAALYENTIAYGPAIDSDPVLAQEEKAQAWRGTLLRHHSVGAWRRLWSTLIAHVFENGEPVTRESLHDWLRTLVRQSSVREFMASCPDTVDDRGHPYPAEREVSEHLRAGEAELAILVLGARRHQQLTGLTLEAFCGGHPTRRQFLNPLWVRHQYQEHENRSLPDFLCAIADDMLAQSRRVALRKLRFEPDGRMTIFSKLREYDGRYTAVARESADNIGLRLEQLGDLSVQLGVLEIHENSITVSDLGRDLLELRA
ncbi:hypothetical protein [Nocardia tengchongensis]|uniref:hypothetical protein n=1 Tax=Nocardia tengchongensis TaxID=2055889 RepID=UPI003607F07A